MGVAYMGSRVAQTLLEDGSLTGALEGTGLSEKEVVDTIHYACLLHDIGHAPFSHVGERFYRTDEILSAMDGGIADVLGDEQTGADNHELMTCLVVLQEYTDKLPGTVDIDLLCRMICGAEYKWDNPRQTLNPVIEVLNSTYDVDRLDYVLRDCRTTGTFGVSIDHERIIRGYAIRDGTLLFLKQALPSVVNLITGRDFLYQWLYNHHTVAYTDLLIERSLRRCFNADPGKQSDVFSLEGVRRGADDTTVWGLLKLQYDGGDLYARPLFDRSFHRTLWKTPYDFDSSELSSPQRYRLLNLAKQQLQNPGERSELETRLQEETQTEEGEVLVATRVVKHFDPTTNRQVYFWISDDAKEYSEVCGSSPFAGGPTDYPLVFYNEGAVSQSEMVKAIQAVVP